MSLQFLVLALRVQSLVLALRVWSLVLALSLRVQSLALALKVKVKEAELYSAFIEVPYTQGALEP